MHNLEIFGLSTGQIKDIHADAWGNMVDPMTPSEVVYKFIEGTKNGDVELIDYKALVEEGFPTEIRRMGSPDRDMVWIAGRKFGLRALAQGFAKCIEVDEKFGQPLLAIPYPSASRQFIVNFPNSSRDIKIVPKGSKLLVMHKDVAKTVCDETGIKFPFPSQLDV